MVLYREHFLVVDKPLGWDKSMYHPKYERGGEGFTPPPLPTPALAPIMIKEQ